jgi:hypothetical protein
VYNVSTCPFTVQHFRNAKLQYGWVILNFSFVQHGGGALTKRKPDDDVLDNEVRTTTPVYTDVAVRDNSSRRYSGKSGKGT